MSAAERRQRRPRFTASRTLPVAVVAAATLGAIALSGSMAGPPGSEPAAVSRERQPGLEALRHEIAGIVEESPVHGVAVAIVSDSGTVWSEGFGTADPATGEPVESGTLFRANSVSKSLVAVAVMRLVEEGALSLDTPLREAAPDVAFGNRWEASAPVTVAHLLEHTSGFDELHLREYRFFPEDGELADALALNPSPRESRWAPGSWMTYNNGGYAVAARIAELARGQSFGEVVRHEVLAPLGMAASGFGIESVDTSRLARHFLGPDAEEPADPYPVIVRPAGGLITSADDLAAVVAMLLRRGEPLLSAASVARMETPTTSRAARAGLAVGYGLGIYGEMDRGLRWLGHAGGTASAWARYAYQPETNVGYVVLMNGAHAPTRRRLEAAIRKVLAPRGAPAASSPDAVAAERRAGEAAAGPGEYAGVYRPAASPWSLTAGVERLLGARRVRVAGGRLVLEAFPAGAPDTLVALGGDRFRTRDATAADVVFLRDDDAAVAGLVTWHAADIRAGNLARSSAAAAWGPLAALGLGLPLMLAALVVVPVRSLLRRVRRRPSPGSPWARRLPFLAALSLVAGVGILLAGLTGPEGLLVLASPGPVAVGFWAALWSFAALSVAALLVSGAALVRERGPGRLARTSSFAAAMGCTTVLVLLVDWGIAGLRTWAW